LTEEGGFTPRRHAERVADLAGSTARRLGLTQREVDDVEFAALLHDLGQLTLHAPIPEGATVLAAPADQQAMASAGAEIIRHSHDLARAADLVEAQSVPYRSVVELAEEVPLPSRILKVANAFDDFSAGRRTADAIRTATERIHLGLGYEYDPVVVAALEQVVEQRWPSGRV
jgi:response regulator RpfG family c-di-GMP phosphodiesterase